jgi:hypothetical protein
MPSGTAARRMPAMTRSRPARKARIATGCCRSRLVLDVTESPFKAEETSSSTGFNRLTREAA